MAFVCKFSNSQHFQEKTNFWFSPLESTVFSRVIIHPPKIYATVIFFFQNSTIVIIIIITIIARRVSRTKVNWEKTNKNLRCRRRTTRAFNRIQYSIIHFSWVTAKKISARPVFCFQTAAQNLSGAWIGAQRLFVEFLCSDLGINFGSRPNRSHLPRIAWLCRV